jgi:hypothetical protein
MTRRVILVAVLAYALSGGRTAIAEQQGVQVPPEPGRPTQARVYVLNRDRADAVPVTIQGVATPDVVKVSVVGTPTVDIGSSTVNLRLVRQTWEYRQITLPASGDPTPALNSAGGEGWELVGSPVAVANGEVRFLFKRSR